MAPGRSAVKRPGLWRGAVGRLPSPCRSLATIEAGYDAGLTLFDTSPYYGYGRSEHRFGQVLRQQPRDSFVLSTKVGRWLQPLRPDAAPPADWRPGGLPFVPTFDYSRDGVMRSLEQSHMRLGLAAIDIAFIHDVDVFTHGSYAAADRRFAEAMDGAYPALDALRRSGEIGAIGVGLNESEWCQRFVEAADLDCILLAGRYTLLEQGALDALLPLCEQKGVGVIIGGPYNSGILAVGPVAGAKYDYADAPAPIVERVRAIAAVCARHDVPLPAAALQFPLAHPAVAAVIPGAVSAVELAHNIALLQHPIPAALWAELKHEGLLPAAAPTP